MGHGGHNSRAVGYILVAVCGLFGGLVTIVGGVAIQAVSGQPIMAIGKRTSYVVGTRL
jgi:hypothetical protein